MWSSRMGVAVVKGGVGGHLRPCRGSACLIVLIPGTSPGATDRCPCRGGEGEDWELVVKRASRRQEAMTGVLSEHVPVWERDLAEKRAGLPRSPFGRGLMDGRRVATAGTT